MTTGLLTMTDDLLIHIASMLTAPTDLVRLQLTCPRFADKVCGSSEMLSIPEEAARLWLEGCSEQERGWVPRRGLESWLGLMHEVGALRLPLAFGRAHADITLSENGAVATMDAPAPAPTLPRSAASKVVMRSGRHFVQFTVVAGDDVLFGVIRPGWDVEGGSWTRVCGRPLLLRHVRRAPLARLPTTGRGCSTRGSRATASACCSTSTRAACQSGRTVERLGVMQAEGLTRSALLGGGLQGDSARIESAAVPAATSED